VAEQRYKVLYENWHKQFPYRFEWRKNDTETVYFNLPIAPSNINISTHFATNVIATMYGTIEEHSEQRYFDIAITGTTGMTPIWFKEEKNVDLAENNSKLAPAASSIADKAAATAAATLENKINPNSKYSTGRAGYSFASSPAGGFFRKTAELIKKAANIADEITLDDPQAYASIPGISDDRATGYAAFHNFYLFLLKYKDSVAKGIKPSVGHPLSFVNYKDNNRYDVSINNFSLVRDARNPMLYNYSISMKAYNLKSANADKDVSAVDQSASLGLNGISNSLFSKVANKFRKAKNAAYTAVAAVKSAGL
jgi:hypothetical protein